MPFFQDLFHPTTTNPPSATTPTTNSQQTKNPSKQQTSTLDIVEVNSDDSDAIVSTTASNTHHKRRQHSKNHAKAIVINDDNDDGSNRAQTRSTSKKPSPEIVFVDMTKPMKRERSDDVVFVSSKKVIQSSVATSNSTTANTGTTTTISTNANTVVESKVATPVVASPLTPSSSSSSGNNNVIVTSNGNNSNNSSSNANVTGATTLISSSAVVNNASTTVVATTQEKQSISSITSPIMNSLLNNKPATTVHPSTQNSHVPVISASIYDGLPRPKIEENSIPPQPANIQVPNQQNQQPIANNAKPTNVTGNNQTLQKETNIPNNKQVVVKITNNSTPPVKTTSTSSNIPQEPQAIVKPKENQTTPSQTPQATQNPVNPVNNNLTIEQLTQQTLLTIANLKRRNDFSSVTCPLTQKIITNAVLASDGIVYDRAYIVDHISKHGSYSPLMKGCKITESSLINVATINTKALQLVDNRISKIVEVLQSTDFVKLSPLIPENYLDLINFGLELMTEGKLSTPSTTGYLDILRKCKVLLLSHYRNKLKQQGKNDQSLYILKETYEMYKLGFQCKEIESIIISLLKENLEKNGQVMQEEKKVELIRVLFTISNLSLPKFITFFNIEKDFALILDIFSVMSKRNICKYEAISTFIIQTLTEINKGEIDNPFFKQLLFFRNQLVIARKEME